MNTITAVNPSISHNTSDQLEETFETIEDIANISNAEFIKLVFTQLPENAHPAICTKKDDPTVGGWFAKRADSVVDDLSSNTNNYINCSSFHVDADKPFNARKENFAATHFLMLDDLGTKFPLELLGDFEPSWLVETSPGNYQAGIIFSDPLVDGEEATKLLDAIIKADLSDPGATGPMSRWARLPEAINGKQKYVDASGQPFQCKLSKFQPGKRYTPEEIMVGLKLESATVVVESIAANPTTPVQHSSEVFTPKANENPIISALKARGLYKKPLGSAKHGITCPWVEEHTDALDSGTAYFEPNEQYATGGFCCQHSHREKYHIPELLEFLNVQNIEARHKPILRLVAGEIDRIVDNVEQVLADSGNIYQSGGLIVSVKTDSLTGNSIIVPITREALTRKLSSSLIWEKFDGRTKGWVRCDPPVRHISILYDAQNFKHLPSLAGVTRQPYFREIDGQLVTETGYDSISNLFGVFDSKAYNIPANPTLEMAQEALVVLTDLLVEFHFVADTDKAAALSAMFTAATRSTLDFAPAYHIKAPVFGSGKTYLCDLIGTFAAAGGNAKVSYPATSEEATKVMLSLLMTCPAVIEFDDMDTDWIPHGTIKRMLTADKITDRILGYSKTATVSTRTLILGSGNNVGPVRDLLRRVLTINIDPRRATPATMVYQGFPVKKVREQREKYISAVFTIILAWQAAGRPTSNDKNIVTYSGLWSDYCRHPLMWLGHPDPATALLEQVTHDPDAEKLSVLFKEWHLIFGSKATTVRKVIDSAQTHNTDLLDAIREFPIEERGSINNSKFGWLLKKNANRIVGGFELQKAEADGRGAWKVIEVNPASQDLTTKTVMSEEKKLEMANNERLDKLLGIDTI